MDTPNIPDPNIVDGQNEINQHAAEIAAIVDRDRKRRKRTLYGLFGLLGLTVALAGVVFSFGRTDQQVMREAVSREVAYSSDSQAEKVIREVEKELPTVIEKEVGPVVNRTLDDKFNAEVRPTFDTLTNQIESIKAQGTSAPAAAPLSFTEVAQIKKAISKDLPAYDLQMRRWAGKMDELAISNAAGSVGWNKDKSGITERLSSLEDEMAMTAAKLDALAKRLDAALQGIVGVQDPCLKKPELESALFRTYSVKENTTSRLHDLDFKVKLKGVKDRTVRGLAVFRTDSVLLAERDVMMGATVSFEDNNFRYTLIPIFINRRFLANDFVGFVISRTRRCPTPPAK